MLSYVVEFAQCINNQLDKKIIGILLIMIYINNDLGKGSLLCLLI